MSKGAVLGAVSIFVFGFLVFQLSTSHSATTANNQPHGSETVPQSSAEQDAPKERWEYGQDTDQMTGQVTQRACLKSTNRLQFSFPYQGGSTGEICVFKGHKRYAYYTVDKGQIICSIEGCRARLKVDSAAPFPVDASESSNGDATVIFFDSQPRIVAIAKKAKEIRVEVPYYQENQQVAVFNPAEPLDPKW